MAFQSGTINPATTSPAGDISKIKNDLAQLKGVIGGTPDGDIPSVWSTPANIVAQTANAATTAGTSTAYTLTPATAIAAYTAGQTFWVTFHTASGAAPTLQISGIASPPNLVRQNTAGAYVNIGASEIPTNHRSRVTLLGATQALVEDMPPTAAASGGPIPLTASINANAFTVTVAAGTTLYFNDGTSVTLGSSISVTVSSGSTLGTVSATPSCVWVAAVKNGGTPELAVRNNVNYAAADALSIAGFSMGEVISTTAEGGAGAADSAQNWYSTTARSSQAWCPCGFVLSTQTTAGTWAQAIDRTVGFGPGVALPGQTIGFARKETGALVSGSTSIPFDDTIPQSTEGVLVLTATYARRLAAGVMEIAAIVQSAESSNTSDQMVAALFQDSVSNALKASALPIPATNNSSAYPVSHVMICGATGNTDIKLRAGLNTASQIDFNGVGGARKYGGALDTSITIREYQP